MKNKVIRNKKRICETNSVAHIARQFKKIMVCGRFLKTIINIHFVIDIINLFLLTNYFKNKMQNMLICTQL